MATINKTKTHIVLVLFDALATISSSASTLPVPPTTPTWQYTTVELDETKELHDKGTVHEYTLSLIKAQKSMISTFTGYINTTLAATVSEHGARAEVQPTST